MRDNNSLRTIEIVTDRQETVAQFFKRQKLVLVDNANSDGKPCSIQQIVSGEVNKFFASYPLQNDQGFAPYLFGAEYQLEKPAPAVAALFADDLALDWQNTILILAPLDDEAKTKENFNKKARLVGRILIKDREKWRPGMDAQKLKYHEPAAKTN